MGFPRQEYWNGLPFPPPGDLLDPGIELASPASIPSIGRWILYHWAIWEAPPVPILVPKPIPIACTYHLLVFGHQNYQYICTYKNHGVYLNIADLYCNHRFCLTWDMQQLYKSESPCIKLGIPLSLHIMFSLKNSWQVIYIELKQISYVFCYQRTEKYIDIPNHTLLFRHRPWWLIYFIHVLSLQKVDQLEVSEHLIEANDLSLSTGLMISIFASIALS